jgi:hypothetical protein
MRSRWLKRELGPGTWKDGEGELVAGRGMREGEGVDVCSWSCCTGEGLGHGDDMVGKLVARERSCDGRVTGLIGKRSTSLTAWWDDGLG